jgi:hypothetical protein
MRLEGEAAEAAKRLAGAAEEKKELEALRRQVRMVMVVESVEVAVTSGQGWVGDQGRGGWERALHSGDGCESGQCIFPLWGWGLE